MSHWIAIKERRLFSDRRIFSYTAHIPERRIRQRRRDK